MRQYCYCKNKEISINEELKNVTDILSYGDGISRTRLIESILINDKNINMIINLRVISTHYLSMNLKIVISRKR
jgi:hypothetical protein